MQAAISVRIGGILLCTRYGDSNLLETGLLDSTYSICRLPPVPASRFQESSCGTSAATSSGTSYSTEYFPPSSS